MVKKETKITMHFKVSAIKSVIRVVGFMALLSSLWIGVMILVTAEVVSVIEELV